MWEFQTPWEVQVPGNVSLKKARQDKVTMTTEPEWVECVRLTFSFFFFPLFISTLVVM